jgi:NifU-like protein involved in Fe-S cluster formation
VITIFASVTCDRLEQVRFEGYGCTLSMAAADVLAELAEGERLEALRLDALLDRLGRTTVGARLDCAGLAFSTLQQALHDGR